MARLAIFHKFWYSMGKPMGGFYRTAADLMEFFKGHQGRPGYRGGSLARGDVSMGIGHVLSALKTSPYGFSVKIPGGERPKDGFMVSPSKATESKFKAKKLREMSAKDKVGFIHDYIRAHADELFGSRINYLGGWEDDNGYLTLDVSRRTDTEAEAWDLGIKGDQDAIYDVVRGVSIPLR